MVAALHERARRSREVAGYVGGLSSGSAVLQAAALQLDAAAKDCEEAAHFCEIAWQRGRDWAVQMVSNASGGSAGVGGGGVGRPKGPTVPERGPAGQSRPSKGPDPVQGPSVPRPPEDGGEPDAQDVIRRLPVRENDSGKTRGFWKAPDGEEKPLASGRGRYQQLADQHARRLGLRPMSNTSHVEIKFALFMRERGLRDETIYINNRPCEGEASCPEWIETFLPKGAELTVHWPGGGPWTFTGRDET
ncbi:DddA-like double-stranded DNA deaminase toxin [Kribbella sp. DT2]|uniref:DddA-like double-stranded DNA deaminase toxin n=1 Tax=Kribbella sp. DT2 TaxID=3393427 RepID=UPI003CF6A23A